MCVCVCKTKKGFMCIINMISEYTFSMIKIFGSYFTYLDKIDHRYNRSFLVHIILCLYLNNFIGKQFVNIYIYIYMTLSLSLYIYIYIKS